MEVVGRHGQPTSSTNTGLLQPNSRSGEGDTNDKKRVQVSVTVESDNHHSTSRLAAVTTDEEYVASSLSVDVELTSRGTQVRRSQRQQLACQHELLLESSAGVVQLQQSEMTCSSSTDNDIDSQRLADSNALCSQTTRNASEVEPVTTREASASTSSLNNGICGVHEKKDSEMESGIDSDQDDDPSSLTDATQAAAVAAAVAKHVTRQTSSIDELIQSLMVPPPPPPSSSVDADELAQAVRCPPPRQSDDIYTELVIPPPPPSHAADTADLEAFLAKIVACNGVVNGVSVHATSKCFGRQMSEPAQHVSTVDFSLTHHCRCASLTNNVQGESTNQLGCCCTDVEVTDQRSIIDGSAVTGGLDHVAARTLRSAVSPPRQDELVVGGTLTRRRPPPPPPRTSSVHNSPALSCRSEQLTRRVLPHSRDRLTELPNSPSLGGRSALIRPAALRSSFSATATTTTAFTSPSSPDWNFGRSHSLTESMPTGGRRSLLSRLKSYWSPSARRQRRPASVTGQQRHSSYWRPQPDVTSTGSGLGLSETTGSGLPGLSDDDDDDLTSCQLQTSPTMSSFSSVACD